MCELDVLIYGLDYVGIGIGCVGVVLLGGGGGGFVDEEFYEVGVIVGVLVEVVLVWVWYGFLDGFLFVVLKCIDVGRCVDVVVFVVVVVEIIVVE